MAIHKMVLEDIGFKPLNPGGWKSTDGEIKWYYATISVGNKKINVYLDSTSRSSWRLSFENPNNIFEEDYIKSFRPDNIGVLVENMMDMSFQCGIAEQKSKTRQVLGV